VAEKNVGKTPLVTDRSWYYTDTAFMPAEDKNALWLAQFLFYAKNAGQQFLDTKRAHVYRALERLEIDRQEYVNIIDPVTPMGGGGKAEFFASDFKANPIDIHLDNIVRAKLDKIGEDNKLQVSEIDKFAKIQKQRDKDKIIYQREFRKLINEVHQELGLPPIKDSQNPYSYVKSLGDQDKDKMINSVDTLLDYIKSQIKDSQDLTLYETYIYKGDIERAFELGIEHYLINLNKWRVKCEYFNNDLKNFNKACGRWYTDETNGRGTVEYLNPERLYTSPFQEKNGEDIVFWFYEKDITFAEFVRQFGTTLTDEQLKEVFELNKQQNAQHGMEWKSARGVKGSSAKIRIGQLSCLTQDADNFSEKYVNNKIPAWQRKPLSWLPEKHTPNKYKSEQRQRIYNVWYSCYYVPPPSTKLSSNSQVDWAWQSQYIFNIKKDVDMYRYGVDMRYAKSTLVIWKDDRPSFTDIKQAFMPKIHTTWHKFQNCLINDVDAVAIAEEFLGAMLNASDEANKISPGDPKRPTGGNGVDAGMLAWKQIKQGNMAFLKMTDKNGNAIVDPSKFVIPIKNGQLERAEKHLQIIMELYNMMTISLAQSDVSEGQDAKPRTPVAGIQASLIASSNGIWFIEKPVREVLIMFGERVVQHILCMVKEKKKYGYKQRWEEFQNVIGLANALMIEGIEDIQPEEIGITVSLEDVRANQQYVLELANKMADNQEIGREMVGLVMSQVSVNYKYAYVLLMVAAKRRQEEIAHKEQLQHERELQLEKEKQQTAKILMGFKTEGEIAKIDEKGKIQIMINEALAKLKHQAMTDQKAQLLENKKEQDKNKAELQEQGKVQDAMAGT
jgi:hypothetical protein